MRIKISEEYTRTPGGRYITEGDFSGEAFRKNVLKEKYMAALELKETLIIDMDGCYGFPSSFLEEAFGGLARDLNDKNILKNIDIISFDEPGMSERIKSYVENAINKR